MSARAESGSRAVGRALAQEFERAAADLGAAEARVRAARTASATQAASQLGRLSRVLRAAKRSPRRWVGLPRQVLGALRGQDGIPRVKGVKRRYRTYVPSGRLELATGPRPALALDLSSVSSGIAPQRGGRAVLTRTDAGVLVVFTAEDPSARYVALTPPMPIGSVFPSGTTVALTFDLAFSASVGVGVNVSWVDELGNRLPGTTYFGSGTEHFVVVPHRAVGMCLFLTLQGDGVALLRSVKVIEKLAAVSGRGSANGSIPRVPAGIAAAQPPNDLQAPLRLSMVIPLYNVAGYIDELLASIEQQKPGRFVLEVVLVDDGSTDSSADRAREWITSEAPLANIEGRLIQQRNAGPSVARNAALEEVTGDYVTFVDGDDVLEPEFCRDACDFILDSPVEVPLVDMRLARWEEGSPFESAVTMLPDKYRDGSRLIDLTVEPSVIKTHVISAFFLRKQLESASIRFPTGIHASEDMLFCASFIRSLGVPLVGAVEGGRYLYRQRSSASEQLSRAVWENPEWLVNKLGAGYLPLMRKAAHHTGQVPSWLASFILYDYRWLLERLNRPGAGDWPDELRDTLLSLVIAGLQLISHEAIDGYSAAPLPDELRQLMHELKDE